MVFFIESAALCLLFTIMVVPAVIKNPLSWISDYPPAIQERARELGLISKEKKKIPLKALVRKAIGTLFLTALLALALVWSNQAKTFQKGFLLSYAIWLVVDWYDALVVDCLWFCHSKKVVLPGTEDMIDAYHDYGFHIKMSVIGMVIGLPVCVLVGLAVMWLSGIR